MTVFEVQIFFPNIYLFTWLSRVLIVTLGPLVVAYGI